MDRNATQAAIRAGYSPRTANPQGARLLANVCVQSAITREGEKHLQKLEITQEMLLRELGAIAFSNIQDYVTWDVGAGALVVKSLADIPPELAAAIQDIDEVVHETSNKDGSRLFSRTKRKVRLYNKLGALKVRVYVGFPLLGNTTKLARPAEARQTGS